MKHLLSIGSNSPDRQERMALARQWLSGQFTLLGCSGVYSTKALNGLSPDYLNMVAEVESPLTASEMSALCKRYEADNGRDRSAPTVAIDVDLIRSGPTILRPAEYLRPYFLEGLRRMPR